MISFEDFQKITIQVGKILEAQKIEQSEKLLLLKVSFGDNDMRQVVSGIAKYYKPTDIVNKKFIFVTNLEPREIFGYQSQAMILAASNTESTDISLLIPDKDFPEGSLIK